MKNPPRIALLLALLAVGLLVWLVTLRGSSPNRVPPVPSPAPEKSAPPPTPPAPPADPGEPAGGTTDSREGTQGPSEEPPPALSDRPAGPGEIVGVALLLPDRQPLAGVEVRFVAGSPDAPGAARPSPSPVVTGENGVFQFGEFPPGRWFFGARRPGKAPRSFRTVLAPGDGVDGIEVLFGGGGAVEGRVEGMDGPVAGIRVRINRSGIGGGPGLVSCVTDSDGLYRLEDLEPGSYTVEVDDGRVSSVRISAGGTARLDFPAGAALAGLVTDADGTPLAGAIVRIRRTEGGYAAVQGRTDEDGRYRIEGLEPGVVILTIQVTGEGAFAADLLRTELVAGENDLDLDLRRSEWAGEISGRVFDAATGRPLGRGRTQISLRIQELADEAAAGPIGGHAMAFADDAGDFRFRALRAGRYRLWVHSFAGHSAFEEEIVLGRGERRTGLEIGLEPAPAREPPAAEESPDAATLAGTILDGEGRPLAGAYVRARPVADQATYRQGRTDGSGRYHLRGLEPGRWRVEVQVVGDGAFAANVGEMEIALGENTFDVRLGEGDLAGEIRGRVFALSSGRPLSKAEVQVSLHAVGPDGKPRFAAMAWADSKGEFRIPYVGPGRYRLRGWPTTGGLAKTEVEVVLGPGEVREEVELALPDLRTGRATFTVRDESGAPVRLVSIESIRDGKKLQGSVTANSSGGVYSTNFEVGVHDVVVRSPNAPLVWRGQVEIREGETTKVEVVLLPEAEEK